MNTKDRISLFLKGVNKITQEISQDDIASFIKELFKAWEKGNTIYIIGNGGSASTSVHFAADLNNVTDKIDNAPRLRAISLNENLSRVNALTNDKGWDSVYVEQLKNFFKKGDVVIAISVHGGSGRNRAGIWSQNLLAALQFARKNGGKALSFTGFDGGAMRDLCNVHINVPANSSPHVEGMHVVLHHLVCDALSKKIAEHQSDKKKA